MKTAMKALSVVLVIASIFGIVGAGLSLKDAMDSKAYWENAGGGSDGLSRLEDGLKQLKDSEAAYLQGREALEEGEEAYEAGQKSLEEGRKQLEEGRKTLEAKQKEYDAGVEKLKEARDQLWKGRCRLAESQDQYDAAVKQLEDAEKRLAEGQAEYDAGQAKLQKAGDLLNGIASLRSGFESWKQGYQALKQFQAAAAAQGITLPDPNPNSAQSYILAINQMLEKVNQGLSYCDQLDALRQRKEQLEAAIAAGGDTAEYEQQLEQVNQSIAQIEAGLNGQTRETLQEKKAMLDKLQSNAVPGSVASGQYSLGSGLQYLLRGVRENTELSAQAQTAGLDLAALESGASGLSTLDCASFQNTMTELLGAAEKMSPVVQKLISEGEAKLAEAKKQLDEGYAKLEAGKKALADAKRQLDEGYETYNAGLQEYCEGKKMLADGAAQLEEGRDKLEDAEKQLEEGAQELKDAEGQLSEGQTQLSAFETGRDQIIAGLDQLLATETYPGVQSISERLGPSYSYMKNETDLDIDRGLEALDAARAFAADTKLAVTKELSGKVIGAIVSLGGTVIALLGGLIGVLTKKKGILSGVIGLIGGIGAAVGVVMSLRAGGSFSAIAGSAGAGLLTGSGIATAAVALLQSVTAFLPKKAGTVPQAEL